MNPIRPISLALATLLQFAPLLYRISPALPALTRSPAAILFKWFAGALAVAGSYHTVSAATATVQSPTAIQGTVGSRLSHQIRISDGKNRQPGSWNISGQNFSKSGSTTVGMPPGLSLSLSTAIISGIPTAAGTYPVRITAYEDPNQRGAKLAFTLTFTIAGGTTPPSITGPPKDAVFHPGESAVFRVVAAGSPPLTYQWSKDGTALPDATSADLAIPHVTAESAGVYSVQISGPGGSVLGGPASLTVVPMRLTRPLLSSATATFQVTTIEGRNYALEASETAAEGAWSTVAEFTASGPASTLSPSAPPAPTWFWRYRTNP